MLERFCSCLYVSVSVFLFGCVFASIFKVSDHLAQCKYSNQTIKDNIDFKIFITSIFSPFFCNFQILQNTFFLLQDNSQRHN